MVPNFVFKQKARAALKDNWQVALMVALIAALPSLAGQVVSIMTQSGMTQMLNNMMLSMQSAAGDVTAAMEQTNAMLSAAVPALGLSLVSGIVSPFLTLGLLNYTFKLLRGENDAPISTVFSRSNCFFKAIGLNLMVLLRTFLWMLPGTVIEIIGMVMVFALPEEMGGIAIVVVYAGMIAMMVLGVRAGMHYSMATRVMAEAPEKGVNQCIRESVAIMSHRKLALFSLELSFILLNLGVTLLESLLLAMVGGVLASTVSMVLSFVITVYMQMAVSAFYLVYRAQPAA